MARPRESKTQPSPGVSPAKVWVRIRAGHTHRNEHFEVDTDREVTPEEVQLLRTFGGLVES